MRMIDISDPLSAEMLRYPSVKPFVHHLVRDYSKGDEVCMSSIEMVVHDGTHIDAPRHYVEGGARIDELPLNRFMGNAQVIWAEQPVITEEVLKKAGITEKMVLVKTPFSVNIRENRPGSASYFTAEAARYLAEKGIELAGIDSFSVDKEKDQGKMAHKILLKAGVLLLEGICLEDVRPGIYRLICFPLYIRNSEAAPCRAVLIDGGENV